MSVLDSSLSVETEPALFLGERLLGMIFPIVLSMLLLTLLVGSTQVMAEWWVLFAVLIFLYNTLLGPFQVVHRLFSKVFGLLPAQSSYAGFYQVCTRWMTLGVLMGGLLIFVVLSGALLYPVVAQQLESFIVDVPDYYASLMALVQTSVAGTPFEPLFAALESVFQSYFPVNGLLDLEGLKSPSLLDGLPIEPVLPDPSSADLSASALIESSLSSTPPAASASSTTVSFPVVLLTTADQGGALMVWLQWLKQSVLHSYNHVFSLVSASLSGALYGVLGFLLLSSLLLDSGQLKQTLQKIVPFCQRSAVVIFCQQVTALIARTIALQWFSVVMTTLLVYGVLLLLHIHYAEVLTLFWAVVSLLPFVGVWFGWLGLLLVLISTQQWLALGVLIVFLALFQWAKTRWMLASLWMRSDLPLESQQIHPFALLVAFAFGVALLGLGGIFVMVPMGAVFVVLMQTISQRATKQLAELA